MLQEITAPGAAQVHAVPDTEPDRLLSDCLRRRTVLSTPLVAVVRWRCCHDNASMRAERQHSSWTMTLLQRGTSTVHSGRWNAAIDPATGLLHAPEVAYRTSHPHGCIDSGWNLAIRADVGQEIVERVIGRQQWRRPSLTIAAQPTAASLARLVGIALGRDPLEAEEQVLEMFATLLALRSGRSSAQRNGTDRLHRQIVDAARSRLGRRLSEPSTLGQVAREVGASPAHLSRLFKRQNGVSMGRYRMQIRIAAAIEMLPQRDRSLAEVALATGFHSQSHLTNALHAEVGLPPGRLRRMGLPVA